MKELRSKIPGDCPVDVKNVKTLDTSDGYAMTATLYYEGKRVAYVENGGHGGPNMYAADPKNPDAHEGLTAAHHYADRWEGEDERDRSENLDVLIEELMADKDLEREARKVAKRGSAFVAVAHKGPYWYGEDESGEPDGYYESYIIGAASRDAFMRHAEGDGYDAYRVLREGITP